MKIKRYKGITRKDCGFDIPADKEISDLPEEVQEKIKKLGEFETIGSIDIQPTTKLDRETMDGIKKDGFFLWKATVTFTESMQKNDKICKFKH